MKGSYPGVVGPVGLGRDALHLHCRKGLDVHRQAFPAGGVGGSITVESSAASEQLEGVDGLRSKQASQGSRQGRSGLLPPALLDLPHQGDPHLALPALGSTVPFPPSVSRFFLSAGSGAETPSEGHSAVVGGRRLPDTVSDLGHFLRELGILRSP